MELSYGSCHRKKLLEVYKVILILICAGGVGKYGSGLSKKKLGLGVGKLHTVSENIIATIKMLNNFC